MANYENIKDYGFDKRSASEVREMQSRGGKRSGESRRKKADFRKILNALLTAKIDNPEWTPLLESLGLDSTLESAVNAAMIQKALYGDVKAYEAIAKYSGQGTGTDADLEEQRIRTDRAKRARDQEVGDTDSGNENIQSFLKAMRPTDEELQELFAEEEEEDDAEEAEETGEV